MLEISGPKCRNVTISTTFSLSHGVHIRRKKCVKYLACRLQFFHVSSDTTKLFISEALLSLLTLWRLWDGERGRKIVSATNKKRTCFCWQYQHPSTVTQKVESLFFNKTATKCSFHATITTFLLRFYLIREPNIEEYISRRFS